MCSSEVDEATAYIFLSSPMELISLLFFVLPSGLLVVCLQELIFHRVYSSPTRSYVSIITKGERERTSMMPEGSCEILVVLQHIMMVVRAMNEK